MLYLDAVKPGLQQSMTLSWIKVLGVQYIQTNHSCTEPWVQNGMWANKAERDGHGNSMWSYKAGMWANKAERVRHGTKRERHCNSQASNEIGKNKKKK